MSKLPACPVCSCASPAYSFSFQGNSVVRCPDCGLIFLNPQPDDAALSEIYSKDYFLGDDSEAGRASVAGMKKETAKLYLEALRAYHKGSQGRLLEIGCGRGDFLDIAGRAGFEVEGVDVSPSSCAEANRVLGAEKVRCGDLMQLEFDKGSFDAVVMFDAIEHSRQPIETLKKVRRLLKKGGTLFMVTPSLDSWSARLLKQHWMEFKPEHLFYFSEQSIQNALAKSAFDSVECCPNTKVLTFDYLHHHFERFKVPLFTRLIAMLHAIFPSFLKSRRVQIPSSGMNVLSRAGEVRALPLLSIIVPVYNEKATFPLLMATLQKKLLPGIEKEIILVESNSKDGTRNEVLMFEGRPGIKIVLEDRPMGKGHAVRAGLKVASGDIIMIQDGDLEYDIDDYDVLLEPLLKFKNAFVLGSRHSGSWKIREFTHQPLIALAMNLAHYFFATLLNLACGSRLRDPFTMYKVFRRDCIHGLTFRANRFDFDFEIMIKLLRKGYKPVEIPVNYKSRSFQEGKKVRLIRDPLTWIWALLRFRFCRLYEKPGRPI